MRMAAIALAGGSRVPYSEKMDPLEDENANKFKDKLLTHPWFKQYLAKDSPITFKGFSNPTPDKDDPSKVFVAFTMECAFTELTRN